MLSLNRIYNMKKLLVLLLLLVGCETSEQVAKRKANYLFYYKDIRTNLCFVDNVVYNHYGVDSHVFSNVPCSDEVEKIIKNNENLK